MTRITGCLQLLPPAFQHAEQEEKARHAKLQHDLEEAQATPQVGQTQSFLALF